MGRRIVQVIVDAHDDVQRAGLDRRGHDHRLDAGVEVLLERLGRSERAAAFEHDINASRGPWNPTWRRRSRERDGTAIDGQRIFTGLDRPIPSTVDGIERQKVRSRRRTSRNLVDVNELQIRASPSGA